MQRRRTMIENKCDECGKKTKVCFRSNNKRYKLYICRKCKLKEENDTESINKTNNLNKIGGKNEKD